MRILLTANASYVPPRGGATRSNLVWLDHMARAGHACRIVCGASVSGASLSSQGEAAALGYHESIAVFAVEDPARRIDMLRRQIHEFAPDWLLVSSEDLGHGLLREALGRPGPGKTARVVYLAHTPQFFPFGPASWNPDPRAAALLARAAAIVAIGHHMTEYIERALGRRAVVIHPPIYGEPPYPNYANFERGFITMINPCAVKGVSIFLETARRLPQYQFAVVPGWGTTSEDRRALEQVPNIRILPNPRNMDSVLAQTRLLLNPALWYEGFGLIVMESMLRGIPVVASDSGGLKEAKCGTGYIIPVKTIERYEPVFDEHSMPRPVLPENDVTAVLVDREGSLWVGTRNAGVAQFSPTTLTASSGSQVTIHFTNADPSTPHNVVVFNGKDATAPALFTGQAVTGPASIDYTFPAPPPGTYFFHCQFHPTTMKGTLVIR